MYLLNSKAFAVQVQVEKFVFDPQNVSKDKESTEKVLNRLRNQDSLGEDYSKLLIPALPCLDLKNSSTPIIAEGFIKTEAGIEILKSGRRSGILKQGEVYLRLKGCGNLSSGFTTDPIPYPDGFIEIRGCCFEHTVLREQYMTWLINEKLKDSGFFTGNIPKEYWRYQSPVLELIPKYCGVFETLGEQRLGSHLIAGIDKLLSVLSISLSEETIKRWLPAARNNQVATVKLIKHTGPLNQSIHAWTSQGVYSDSSQFVDILQADTTFSFIQDSELTLNFTQTTKKKTFEDLCLISYRIGWEVGTIKRVFQDNDINWGYFIDHNPFEPHCNAHCNNFVVLGPGNKNLLAPLDFDMAFEKHEFVSTMEGDGFGKCDEELFENWVNCERVNLELALAGQENMANFSYSDGGFSVASVFCKDLMVLGFRHGFERLGESYFWERERVEGVIRECLKMTSMVEDY